MMDSDGTPVTPGRYDEPQERLTRLTATACEAMLAHPEFGDDIRGAFMVHDEANGSGSCLVGYPEGEEVSFDSMQDVVQHIKVLFRSMGIDMKLDTVSQENPGATPGEHAEGDVVLTIMTEPPDPRMQEVLRAVKQVIEAKSAPADSKMIIIMTDDSGKGGLMHHGYESDHHVAHALFDVFQQIIVSEGGRVAVVPIMGSPN